MMKIYVQALILMILFLLATVSAYAGGILFTKFELTREGFEQYILRFTAARGWWQLYKCNICAINPDGTGFKQLTNDGVSYHARWSPDGHKIAFLSGPSSMMSFNVMNEDGSNRIELLSDLMGIYGDIYDYRWSPDGTKILLFLENKMNPRTPNEAWVVSARIASRMDTSSSDGTKILLFLENKMNPRTPNEAWVVTVSDGSVSRMGNMGNAEWAKGWNHWAPEGATIVNPNHRLLRLLKALPSGTEWPEWSPNGNYIAFIYNGRLIIADAQKTGMLEPWKPTNTEPPCDRIGNWTWSPNGEKLLFFAGGYVCSVNMDGTDMANLSLSLAEDACWSPNGSQIAFITSDGRKKNSEIFIANADGTDQKQLTNTNYFHGDIDWR